MALIVREAEYELVAGLIAGGAASVYKFSAIAASSVWAAVVAIEGEGTAAEAAFARVLETIKKDGFRLLQDFDGRAELAVFLKLLARQILCDAIAVDIVVSPQETWPRFERAFGRKIRRRIASRFPRESGRHDDLYQEICLLLIDTDYKRLRRFDGRGRFEAYVAKLVENILIDLMRKEKPRRRLPVAVEAMGPIEQAIFRMVGWQGGELDAKKLHAALAHRFEGLDLEATGRALEIVRGALDKARAGWAESRPVAFENASEEGPQVADAADNPEEALLSREAEARIAQFRDEVQSEAARMPEDERAYLSVMLASADPLPPREAARRLGKPVEDVRRIHNRVLRRLKNLPGARKMAALSVSIKNDGEDG